MTIGMQDLLDAIDEMENEGLISEELNLMIRARFIKRLLEMSKDAPKTRLAAIQINHK